MIQLVLKKSGADNNPTVFLFNDTQLKMEQFLEDINNILNTGEVGTIISHHPIHYPPATCDSLRPAFVLSQENYIARISQLLTSIIY